MRGRDRGKQRGLRNNPFEEAYIKSKDSFSFFFFVLLAILQIHTAHEFFCGRTVAYFQRSENSCLERFLVKSQQWHGGALQRHALFHQLHGKRKFKGTLPCVEKRLPGRLTQLPFIASDKRLNHTLHCLKCLLVIRSRILLSLLPLADCS